jgi:hypothetical protein
MNYSVSVTLQYRPFGVIVYKGDTAFSIKLYTAGACQNVA